MSKVGDALVSGRIGYEAACLVARVATFDTVTAWVERAERRTFKHLREEVGLMEMFARVEGDAGNIWPPTDDEMEEAFGLERAVLEAALTGKVAAAATVDEDEEEGGDDPSQMSGGSSSPSPQDLAIAADIEEDMQRQILGDDEPAEETSQMSGDLIPASVWEDIERDLQRRLVQGETDGEAAKPPSGGFERWRQDKPEPKTDADSSLRIRPRPGAGKVTLRLRVSDDLYWFWLALEEAHARSGVPGPFLAYLCLTVWQSWLGAVTDKLPAYYEIYLRDRFRCSCPVCSRRDVHPHHLKLRSRGGGDEEENLCSPCTFCHLFGIHEGRIKAEPPASAIRWTFGTDPTRPVLVVEGRDKLVA